MRSLRMAAAAAALIFVTACTKNDAPAAKPAESPKPAAAATSAPAAAATPTTAPTPAGATGDSVLYDPSKATLTAPENFNVKLETTKGDIVIEIHRAWAPNGADRFFNLVKAGFYNDIAFFRVVPDFMAQTGLNGDPKANAAWRNARIKDDPVTQSNKPYYVSFATSGPDSRTTQFFINFADNSRLDGMGFSPLGKLTDPSVAVFKTINGEYGEGAPGGNGPSQGRIQFEGNDYLKKEFPRLDYIKTATVQ